MLSRNPRTVFWRRCCDFQGAWTELDKTLQTLGTGTIMAVLKQVGTVSCEPPVFSTQPGMLLSSSFFIFTLNCGFAFRNQSRFYSWFFVEEIEAIIKYVQLIWLPHTWWLVMTFGPAGLAGWRGDHLKVCCCISVLSNTCFSNEGEKKKKIS